MTDKESYAEGWHDGFESRDEHIVQLTVEIARLRPTLDAVRIWMKNIDRRPTEEPLYQAICAALEPKP